MTHYRVIERQEQACRIITDKQVSTLKEAQEEAKRIKRIWKSGWSFNIRGDIAKDWCYWITNPRTHETEVTIVIIRYTDGIPWQPVRSTGDER